MGDTHVPWISKSFVSGIGEEGITSLPVQCILLLYLFATVFVSVAGLSVCPCVTCLTKPCHLSKFTLRGPGATTYRKQALRLTVYFSKALSERLIFEEAYIQRGLSTEGALRFKIDWASLLVGRKFTVSALFYLRAISKYKHPGGQVWGHAYMYIWRGFFLATSLLQSKEC